MPFVTVATPTSEEAPKTVSESAAELTATAFVDAVPAGQSATEQVAVQPSASQFSPEASAVVTADAAAPVVRDALNQESEIAANTAAALGQLAAYSRVSSSGEPTGWSLLRRNPKRLLPVHRMRRRWPSRLGLEKSPEESSAASDDARESDTDTASPTSSTSVLAEMRPKIYEEISRKMKKEVGYATLFTVLIPAKSHLSRIRQARAICSLG